MDSVNTKTTWTSHRVSRRSRWVLQDPDVIINFSSNNRQAYFASEILWALTIPFVKSSILMLYCYIFGCLRYFRRVACAIGSFSICWSVAVIIVLACKCRPIQSVWDKSSQGTCFSDSTFYIASSVPNTMTDIAILLLPMKAVAQLQTTRSQKLLLVFIFSLGSL